MSECLKNNFIDIKIKNSQKIIENFRHCIDKYDCPEVALDLSALNIIDATRVLVLSSTYHLQKHPNGKLKCHVKSSELKNLISTFATKNLELV